MAVQALSLAKSYDRMFQQHRDSLSVVTQWHPFDHQRGYHPDPYWGGTDAFRQPKYAYYMFKSQVNPQGTGARCGKRTDGVCDG